MGHRRGRLWLALLTVLAVGLLGTGWRAVADEAKTEGRAAFEAGLEEAHDHLGRERCRKGLALVQELLAGHESAPYVLARRVEIEDLVRRLAFGVAHPPPKPQDVVHGKLIRYLPTSGKLRIRYTPKDEEDLVLLPGGLLAFPARMMGPFTVTLEGDRLPASLEDCPQLAVGNEEDPKTGRKQVWILVAGSPKREEGSRIVWLPARLVHKDGDEATDLGTLDPPPVRIGKRYTLKVEVRSRKVSASVNGRKLGTGTKAPEVYGLVAFDARNWTRLTIDGRVEPSWIQGRIDEVVQKNLAAFRATYAHSEYLPAWLLTAPVSSAVPGATDAPPWPDDVAPLLHAALAGIEAALEKGSPGFAEAALAKLVDADVPPSVIAYLMAVAHLSAFRLPEALAEVDACLALAPTWLKAQLLKARVLDSLGRIDDASAVLEAAEARHPTSPAVFERAVLHLLLAGNPDGAKRVFERATERQVTSEDLATLGRALVKASSGPSWTRVHEYESPHYHVFSDIDIGTCRKAAKTLEEAYNVYQGTLKRVARDGRRFRVYLFRGRDGFVTYMKDLGALGAPVHMNVAGVYSPLLKQLLIWNLPNREMMLRTVRHEGLHQYLDRFLPRIPVWFNEGLAEYYEHAHRVGGRIYFGRPRRDYVEFLTGQPPVPLADFLTLSPREFYRGGARNYAQAWALVHMLRHGSARWKDLFQDLLADLEAMPMHEALEKAFGHVPPAELEAAFLRT